MFPKISQKLNTKKSPVFASFYCSKCYFFLSNQNANWLLIHQYFLIVLCAKECVCDRKKKIILKNRKHFICAHIKMIANYRSNVLPGRLNNFYFLFLKLGCEKMQPTCIIIVFNTKKIMIWVFVGVVVNYIQLKVTFGFILILLFSFNSLCASATTFTISHSLLYSTLSIGPTGL